MFIGSSNKDFSSSCRVSRSCSPGTTTLAAMASEGKEKKRKGTSSPDRSALATLLTTNLVQQFLFQMTFRKSPSKSPRSHLSIRKIPPYRCMLKKLSQTMGQRQRSSLSTNHESERPTF